MNPEAMTIEDQIELARSQVRETCALFARAGRAAPARLVEPLFELVLPNLRDSAAVSPVYHPTTLMRIIARTALEDGLSDFETRILLMTAGTHDMCLGAAERTLSLEPSPADIPKKIRATTVRTAVGERKQLLVKFGIHQRMLHGDLAAIEAPEILRTASLRSGVPVDFAEIDRTLKLIPRHDLPSVAELKFEGGESIGASDLFRPDDRLELLFRCIDRLWMVTPEGVDVDVARDRALGATEATETLRALRIDSNARRHFEEYELYKHVYQDRVHLFGFIENSLYVSPAAFRAFTRMRR